MLASMRDERCGEVLTYGEVGATRGELPPGYHHVRQSRRIGMGRKVFDDAVAALLGWEMHRRAGLRVAASTLPPQEGGTVTLRLLGLRVPCQVVYMVAEPQRAGFAYGTLPGHPECGEELFLIELDPRTGEVRASVTAFSRPANWLLRLGGPVNRWVQSVMTRRYLRALDG